MRRRDFIAIVGNAAIAWPLNVRAQQTPVIGFLGARSQEDSADLVAAFRTGLGETGFVEDRNVRIEFGWAESHYDRFPALAGELVAHRVAAIVTTSVAGVLAAKAATSTIPIVFSTGVVPVQFGWSAVSTGRPAMSPA